MRPWRSRRGPTASSPSPGIPANCWRAFGREIASWPQHQIIRRTTPSWAGRSDPGSKTRLETKGKGGSAPALTGTLLSEVFSAAGEHLHQIGGDLDIDRDAQCHVPSERQP